VAEGEFPCSFAQRRLWFLDHLEPGNSAYNVCAWFMLTGQVDPALLERALNVVVKRQPSLRTVFREQDGEPLQVVRPYAPVHLERVDISRLESYTRGEEAFRVRRAEAARPFDLAAGPLFRVTLLTIDPGQHAVLISMHHTICDGWSVGIFVDELRGQYKAAVAGQIAQPEPVRLHYGEYARRERQRLTGPERERLLGYWRGRLAGAPPAIELPTDRPRPARQTFNGSTVEIDFSSELSAALRALARRERATLFMTLLALFNVLMHRYSGQSSIVVGTPVSNRDDPQLERLIGLFVSTIAIRTDIAGDPTLGSLIAQTRENILEAQAHQELPFELLVEALRPERSFARSPIFQVVFVLQTAEQNAPFAFASAAAMYDLSVFVRESRSGIHVTFEYNTDLFDESTIERMSTHFEVLAQAAVRDPELTASRMPMMTEDERAQILADWNDTSTEYPRDAGIAALLDEVASQAPTAIALESTDASREVIPVARLTYSELRQTSDRLAARLRARGVDTGMRVGVLLERSVGAVVTLAAILKTGAAYVPIEPGSPSARAAEILSGAGVRYVVTQRKLAARIDGQPFEAVLLEEEWLAETSGGSALPGGTAQADSPAYVMFTSGTTGRPKGVCVTHRNISRLVCSTSYVRLGPDDVVLQFAPLAFDASTFEIWGALLNGARLVVFPERVPTARAFAEVLDAHRVTTLWLTAGFFQYMVEQELSALARVRQVLAGGDVLSITHVQKLLNEKTDGVVVNGYGPTENTTFTCCHSMLPGSQLEQSVPIGRPIANTRVYILDAAGAPVPIGVAGELYAAGDGVARGYLGEEPGASHKFLADPFSSQPGARMYRTGDMARWRADGTIEFLGRRDRQVKVRGFRVELEEIEDALRAAPGVQDAAVIARRDASGSNVLIGYLVPGAAIDIAAIRRSLLERVPDYMMPGAFVTLEKLPLTKNGKVDRDALPEPIVTPRVATVEPRTTFESQLLSIWERVLGHSGFGVCDNFFEIGGHSLLAVRMFAQVERVFGRRLPASALFLAPTVEQLAARLESEGFRSPWASLVVIQPDGPNPPLIMVPGMGGNVVGYADLARLLGPQQPLYALQSRGLDGRDLPFERIEPMAVHYLSEIRKVQPSGPYYLGGACFGGAVAYEMAQQLRAAGEEVAFLMLLDTWPPPRRRPILDSLLRHSHHITFLADAAKRNLMQLLRQPFHAWPGLLRNRTKVISEMIVQRDVYRGDSAAMYVDRVSRANYKAFSLYRPRPYDGALMLVFAATRNVGRVRRDPRLLWGALARGGCTRLDVPARDSGLILKSPHVEVLAEWVAGALRNARRRADGSATGTFRALPVTPPEPV
jgi:aspartate racemase